MISIAFLLGLRESIIMQRYLKTCFHRFLGQCPKCDIDYNIERHPNNFDCRGYKPFKILIVEVIEVKDIVKKKDIKRD